MAIAASSITPTNSLEDFRIEFNNLVSDVSANAASNTFSEAIVFEGATADAYETTLTLTDPTADRTLTLPNVTGNVTVSGNPVSADGEALGSTSLEWSDLYLADGSVIYFGADQDVTLTHAADTSLTLNLMMAATTFEPTGDTASGDNAAIGYTSAEGLILTGQGSTSDITLKNDADGTVFTVPTGTDDILFPDNAKAMFGASSDLQIYHDGSSSYISDQGTGGVTILTNSLNIKSAANDETHLATTGDNSVVLYYDNTAALATASGGGTLTGTWEVTTALVPDASDGAALGTTALEWSDLYLADGAVIGFGDDQDITLTHVHGTGLLFNSVAQFQFRDSAIYINSSTDGQLDIVADTEIQIAATTVDLNGNLDVSGTIVGASTITAGTAVVPDASDGAALGTTALEWSDLFLADGAVINFGDDQDVTLTHVVDTGLTLDGSLGIGETVALGKLHVKTADAGATSINANGDEFIIEGSAAAGMTIIGAADNLVSIFMGDAADADIAGISYDNSGNSMRFTTNTSEAIRITSAGAVGIGETVPLGDLHVKSADAGATSISANGDELVIEGSGNVGMTLLGGTGNLVSMFMGDASDADIAGIGYDNSGNSMRFNANAAEAMRITSAGDLGIGTTAPLIRLDAVEDNIGGDVAMGIFQSGNAYGNLSSSATLYLGGTYHVLANAAKIISSHALGGTGNHGQSISFYAVNTGSTPFEHLRLDLSGNASLMTDGAVLKFGADQDVTLTHAADTSLTLNLMMAATTFEPSGDTASGDNAAIGYTSAEGLILTGQGSTSDITLKNDADGTVFTVPTGTDDILFPDNAKAMWGAGSDLQIHHSGSHSYIDDAGTGDMYIRGDNTLYISNAAGSETKAAFTSDGACNLYYNNASVAMTNGTAWAPGVATSTLGNTSYEWADAYFADGAVIYFGDDQDVTLTHSADAGLILGVNGSGTSGTFTIDQAGAGDPAIRWATAATSYVIGIDNSDSDNFKIDYGTVGVGGQTGYKLDTSGNSTIKRIYCTGVTDATGGLFVGGTTVRNAAQISSDYTSAAQAGLAVNDTASGNGGAHISFLTGGTVRASITNNNNTAVAYNTSSDARLKENIRPILNAVERLKTLNPVKFDWIQSGLTSEGFIAQEIVDEQLAKDMVTGDPNGDVEENPMQIEYGRLTVLLTKALQESLEKIDTLETRIETLEGK